MTKRYATIDDMFRNTVEQYPDKTAIIFKEDKITFSTLNKSVSRLAAALSKDVDKHERIAIYLPHMPEWIIIWFALHRIGAVPVPVTHFYKHKELAYIVNDSGSEIVFCSNRNFEQVMKVSTKNPLKKIIVVGNKDQSGLEEHSSMQQIDVVAMDDLLGDNYLFSPIVEIDGRDTAELLYTGGTTGLPKGVPIKHVLFLDTINGTRKGIETIIPEGEAITIQGAPFNHIFGQDLGLGALLSGDTLILLPRLDLGEFLFHVDKYKATTLFGTPTFFKMLLEYKNIDNYNLKSVLYAVCAGEALPSETAKRWTEKVGNPLYSIYGTTETCGYVAGATAGEPFPKGTVGRVVPTKQARLVDPDTLKSVSVNEPGTLLVSSKNMVTGYWNKPEETALHFINLDGTLWYKTGDILRMDENGWLFFIDRSVDMIKHKGYRIAATKIESVILKHEAVSECCVVGIPDKDVGEKIKAFVVIRMDAKDVTVSKLLKWCEKNLAAYEIPHYIEFRNSLPKSAVGKLLRRKLRDKERQKQAGSPI
mgnify:CR=1 FL=1